MKVLLLIVFLLSVSNGFTQTDGNPFHLPPHSIKENQIKSITEYDHEGKKVNFAQYDHHGNEIYHEEDDRVIEFKIDYDEEGHVKQEVVTGFRHEHLLNKRPILGEAGRIDSIIYELPLVMYYSGFIEKYNYHQDGRIKTVDVYSVPENDLMFTHQYTYASGFRGELLVIRTYVGDEQKKTLFRKKFSYDKWGNLEKSSQLTANGDTIAVNFYGQKGRLLKEIVSYYYTQPSSSMYSSIYYAEALGKIKTPLTDFILAQNVSRENYGSAQLLHIEHQYNNDKLLKSERKVKNGLKEHILVSDTYTYDDQSTLVKRVTINHANNDTSTVRFSYDSTQLYIHLSEKSRSYLIVRSMKSENTSGELIVEAFQSSWECKTTTDFDSIANIVTKKRFCKGDDGKYPIEPDQITVASFDSFGRQIEHETSGGIMKAPSNKSYEFSDNGQLTSYDANGQFWKYIYDSNDSILLKQENYKDSTYEVMEYYYQYAFDEAGNYTAELIYVNETKRSPFLPVFQKFDSQGRVLEEEWEQVEEYSARKVTYSYNDRGLCVRRSFSQWGDIETTRYDYEFY